LCFEILAREELNQSRPVRNDLRLDRVCFLLVTLRHVIRIFRAEIVQVAELAVGFVNEIHLVPNIYLVDHRIRRADKVDRT